MARQLFFFFSPQFRKQMSPVIYPSQKSPFPRLSRRYRDGGTGQQSSDTRGHQAKTCPWSTPAAGTCRCHQLPSQLLQQQKYPFSALPRVFFWVVPQVGAGGKFQGTQTQRQAAAALLAYGYAIS